jgi:hypothetical protein
MIKTTVYSILFIWLFASIGFSQGVDAGVGEKKKTTNASKIKKKSANVSGKPSIILKKVSETNRKQKISISASYPQISGTSADADFNRLSLQIVKNQIADFKKDLEKPDRNTSTRELGISYVVSFLDNRIVSISFGAGVYSGGVHPNSYTFVLNYDLKEKRILELSDLFKNNSNYLNTISNYCIQRLRKKGVGDDDWIQTGAGASFENYRNWTITKRGISITFDAYQVASYAEGPQYVDVPFSAIRKLISKDSPIGYIVK